MPRPSSRILTVVYVDPMADGQAWRGSGGMPVGGLHGTAACAFATPAEALAAASEIGRGNASRIGVATGEALQTDDDITGEAVDRAALIAARARTGQILIDDVTHRLTGKTGPMRTQDAGWFRLRGHPERVRLFEARAADTAEVTLRRTARTPFTGRRDEMASLRRLLDDLGSGRGSLVFVAGDPGTGKSRLIEQIEAEARFRGVLALTGTCHESTMTVPFTTVIEIIDRAAYIAGVHTDDGGWSSLFVAGDRAGHKPAGAEPAHLTSFLCDIIERSSVTQPMMIAIEDLQWADASTVAAIAELAERLDRASVLIVCTYRPDEIVPESPAAVLRDGPGRDARVHHLSIGPLDAVAVGEIIRSLTGLTADPAVADALARDTLGNPYFVEETVRHLAESGRLFDAAGRIVPAPALAGGIPESVRLIIAQRIERTSPSTQRLLRALAVAGSGLRLPVLEALGEVEGDALIESIDEAERAGLIAAGDRGAATSFWFTHDLIRQTLLAGMTTVRLQQLHAAVARALQHAGGPRVDPGFVAHHLEAAGSFADRDATLRALLAAGTRALKTGAVADAAARFESALAMADDGSGDQAAALDGRGRCRATTDPEAGLADLHRALAIHRETGDTAAALATTLGLYEILSSLGRADEAVALAEASIDANPDPTGDLVWLEGMVGVARGRDDRAGGTALIDRAVTHAEGLGPAERGRALSFRATDAALRGDIETALRDGADALHLLHTTGEGMAIHALRQVLAAMFVTAGRLAEARSMLAVTDGPDARAADPGVVPRTRVLVRMLDLALTAPDPAAWEAALREESGYAVTADARRLWHDAMGNALAAQGRWREAAAMHEKAEGDEAPSGWQGVSAGFAFRAHAFAGNRSAAARALKRISPVADPRDADIGPRLASTLLVEGHIAAGDDDAAASLYPIVRDTIERGAVVRIGDGRLLRIVAGMSATAAGLWDEAEEHFEEAMREATALPAPAEHAEALHRYARALLRRGRPGDRERATAMLNEAAVAFRRFGMAAHERLANETLEATRAPAATTKEAPAAAGVDGSGTLRHEGDVWTIGLDGRTVRVKDSRGVRFLARLLAEPGREFHVLDLVAGDGASAPEVTALKAGDAGETLDAQAIATYRARLRELSEELEEAEAFNDDGRRGRINDEIEALTQQLAGGVGMGGRARKAGSPAERARINVRNSIASLLKSLDKHDPALGRHLRNAVKTGTYCSYAPDRPIHWSAE